MLARSPVSLLLFGVSPAGPRGEDGRAGDALSEAGIWHPYREEENKRATPVTGEK